MHFGDVEKAATKNALLSLQEEHRKCNPLGPLATDPMIVEEINKFFRNLGDLEKKELGRIANFNIDPSTISRLRTNSAKTSNRILIAIYLYLHSKYDIELQNEILEESMRAFGLVGAMQKALGFEGGVNTDSISTYQGSYEVYRSAYWDNNLVMVSRLDIGLIESGIFSCRLLSRIDNDEPDVYQGHVVPHGKKIIAVLASKLGNIYIHIDRKEANSSKVKNMSGICLASVGQDPSSAWPVFAKRCDADFEPKVISRTQAGDGWDTRELGELRKALARGFVGWETPKLPPKKRDLAPSP